MTAPTGQSYRLRTIEDLASIPADRFGAFASELPDMAHALRESAVAAVKSGTKLVFQNGVVWVDDGGGDSQIAADGGAGEHTWRERGSGTLGDTVQAASKDAVRVAVRRAALVGIGVLLVVFALGVLAGVTVFAGK